VPRKSLRQLSRLYCRHGAPRGDKADALRGTAPRGCGGEGE
jgi:hypothetical protein